MNTFLGGYMKNILKFTSILALVFGMSSVVNAQHAGAPAGQAAEAVSHSFTEEQKDAFVQAYLQVNQIQQQFRSQLDPEMTEEQMEEVANAANQQIETAIDAQDNMNTDTYRQILVAIETDQELLNDIQNRLESL